MYFQCATLLFTQFGVSVPGFSNLYPKIWKLLQNLYQNKVLQNGISHFCTILCACNIKYLAETSTISQFGVGVPGFSDLYLMIWKVLQNLSQNKILRNCRLHNFSKIICAYYIKYSIHTLLGLASYLFCSVIHQSCCIFFIFWAWLLQMFSDIGQVIS